MLERDYNSNRRIHKIVFSTAIIVGNSDCRKNYYKNLYLNVPNLGLCIVVILNASAAGAVIQLYDVTIFLIRDLYIVQSF